MLILISGDSYDDKNAENIIFSSKIDHPTPQIEVVYERICEDFFSTNGISQILKLLSECTHKISREELKLYIRGLHGLALNCICNVLRQEGLLSSSSYSKEIPNIFDDGITQLLKIIAASQKEQGDQERKSLSTLFQAADFVNKAFGHMRYFKASNIRDKIWQTAVAEFPDEYVTNLDKLIFSSWYAACFVSDPSKASMWGHYGDSHNGVCLKFRNSSNGNALPSLKLRRVTGWSSDRGGGIHKIYESVRHDFVKMTYVSRFVEVDFFRSIGRIRTASLRADWYTGANGEKSICADDFFLREDEWRKAYWNRFQTTISAKFKDWEHESEFRLILSSAIGGFEDPIDRKMTYEFADLEGIIFGIKTSIEDKKRIVEIVKRKCLESKRTVFDFGQAFYSIENGKIEIAKLNLLNFD